MIPRGARLDPRLYQIAVLALLLAYGALALDFDVRPLQCGAILATALGVQLACARVAGISSPWSKSSCIRRAMHPRSTPTRLPRWGPRGWLRCSSLRYSRYCTPPCTTRTVGAPPVGRRAVRYRGPQRGSRAGVVVGAPRPSRCDARLLPRAA